MVEKSSQESWSKVDLEETLLYFYPVLLGSNRPIEVPFGGRYSWWAPGTAMRWCTDRGWPRLCRRIPWRSWDPVGAHQIQTAPPGRIHRGGVEFTCVSRLSWETSTPHNSPWELSDPGHTVSKWSQGWYL